MVDKLIFNTINEMFFVVDLRCGKVTTQAYETVKPGPYRVCRNVYEANFYSLNILRQNINENEYKIGKKPDDVFRDFLGDRQTIKTETVIPTMNWIQNTFPEKFI